MVYVKFDIDSFFYSSFKSLVFSDQHVELTILCSNMGLWRGCACCSKWTVHSPNHWNLLTSTVLNQFKQVCDSDMALNGAMSETQVKTFLNCNLISRLPKVPVNWYLSLLDVVEVEQTPSKETFPLQVQTLSAAPTSNSNSASRQRVRKRTKVLSIARK